MKRAAPHTGQQKKQKQKKQATKGNATKVYMTMPQARSGAEVKALSINVSTGGGLPNAFQINAGGTIIPLNLIASGSSFFQRVGRKITLKSLKVQFNINPRAVAATAIGDLGRIMIFYDRQTNGATPTIADVLQDVSAGGATSTGVVVGPNLNNRNRFTILRDYKFTLPAVTNTAAGVPSAVYPDAFEGVHQSFIEWYIKFKNFETIYGADTADIGSVVSGGLFALVLGGLGTAGWEVNSWHSRLRYWDM